MPEGFNSVADLKVIVDANSDKFHSGLNGVKQALGELDQHGNKSLSGLDKMMAMVGDGANTVVAKFTPMGRAVQGAAALFDQLAKHGRSLAETLGATAEYDGLTASLGSLGLTIKDTATSGFAMLASSTYASAASVLGFKSNTDETSFSVEDFAKRVLRDAKEAVDDYAMSLRMLTGDIKQTPAELDKAVESYERNAKRFRDAADYAKSWGLDWVADHLKGVAESIVDERDKAEDVLNEGLSDGRWAPKVQLGGKEIVELLGRENAALERRTATMRMSAAAAAEYSYIQDKIADGLRKDTLNEAAIQAIQREGARIRENTQALEDYTKAKQAAEKVKQEAERDLLRNEQLARQRERAGSQIFATAEREISTLKARADAIGLNARETAELLEYERLIYQIRALGGPETVEQNNRAKEIARVKGELAEQADVLRQLGEVSQSVASEMSSAFAKFTSGTKVEFADMAKSILADLAQIALRKSILEPMFGGGASGGSGIFGAMLGSIFGGFRADGGDVDAGRAYMVGERGPEMFIPKTAGTILSNGQSAGGRTGGEVHVYVHGTPEFDARVESTAEGVVVRSAPAIISQAEHGIERKMPVWAGKYGKTGGFS